MFALPAPLRPGLPQQGPRAAPASCIPVQGSSIELPLTSLEAKLGPHWVWKELSEEARRQVSEVSTGPLLMGRDHVTS